MERSALIDALMGLRERVAAAMAAAADVGTALRFQSLVDALDRLRRACDNAAAGNSAGAVDELDRAVGDVGDAEFARSVVALRADALDAFADAAVASRSGAAKALPVRAPTPRVSQAPQPVPKDIAIRFGAGAQASVVPGGRFVAQFVAYREGDADAARRLLAEGDGDGDRAVAEVGSDAVAEGTVIEVALSGADLLVEGGPRDVQRFVWTGKAVKLVFEVQAAGVTAPASTVLRYDVLVDGFVLGRIRLPLAISAKTDAAARSQAESRLAKTAFASYSSKDRDRVIDRVAAIRIAAKVDVFLDCHDLNPGDAWEAELARRIDDCDTFMLFWSDDAATSKWVRWEWKRALDQRGLEHMQFHPLENGVRPPPELRKIHLGDPYMALRAAERIRRATRSERGPSA